MTLHELILKAQAAASAFNPETGELDDAACEAMVGAEADVASKIDAYFAVDSALTAQREALEAQAAALVRDLLEPIQRRAKALEKKRDSLRERLASACELAGGDLRGEACVVKIRTTKPVMRIVDESAIPLDFLLAARSQAASKVLKDAEEEVLALKEAGLPAVRKTLGAAWFDDQFASGQVPAGIEYKAKPHIRFTVVGKKP